MRTRIKVLAITIVVAVPAFLLGPVLFPPAEAGPQPTVGQIPFLVFLDVVQAVSLGLGVSFLLFGLPVMRRVSPDSKARAWAMYLCIGYFMVSWWPHINMHVHNAPDDMQGLLYIDYLFHLPLIICGGVLAYSFLSLVRDRRRERGAYAAGQETSSEGPLSGTPAR